MKVTIHCRGLEEEVCETEVASREFSCRTGAKSQCHNGDDGEGHNINAGDGLARTAIWCKG